MNTKTRKVQISKEQKPQIQRDWSIQSLFNEIRPYKPLSTEETKKLFRLYHKSIGEEKNQILEKICKHNMRLVISVARDYCSANDSLSDLIQEGNIGLLKAIDMFDENNGAPFYAYAVHWIRRYINLYKTTIAPTVLQTNKSKTVHVIGKIISDLTYQLDRTPTYEEILDEYNLRYPNKKINNTKDLVNVEYVFIDQIDTSGDSKQDLQGYTEYSTESASHNTYLQDMTIEHNKAMVKQLMHNLTPNECKVVKMLYGIDDEIRNSIIGVSTELGVSKQRVSQLYATAMKKMKQEHKRLAYAR